MHEEHIYKPNQTKNEQPEIGLANVCHNTQGNTIHNSQKVGLCYSIYIYIYIR